MPMFTYSRKDQRGTIEVRAKGVRIAEARAIIRLGLQADELHLLNRHGNKNAIVESASHEVAGVGTEDDD